MTNLPALRLSSQQSASQSAIPGPDLAPELYEGLLLRRATAFIIDWLMLLVLIIAIWWLKFILAVVSFGLIPFIAIPLTSLVPPLYAALTLKAPPSATLGMRLCDVTLRTADGKGLTLPIGFLHAVSFYVTFAITGALILLLPFFDKRGRLAQDLLLGVQAVRASRFDQTK